MPTPPPPASGSAREPSAASASRSLGRLAAWISDLRLAIVLLLVIAVASGIGTAVPQRETEALYHQLYDATPWLGVLQGDAVLSLQLDHVYSSSWFLGLLAWLALSLLLCSWRRQWPALRAALRWIDYRSPRQLSKLSLAETLTCDDAVAGLDGLEQRLRQQGWQIRRQEQRLAARKGLLGRVGPLLVHAGLVVLMLGAAWGALGGRRAEQFLAPGRTLELMDSRGRSELTLALDRFAVERDPAGRPEQFRSSLRILEGTDGSGPPDDGRPGAATPGTQVLREAEISVNHPLRFRGVTFYQADWGLATISVQLGRSPVLELPLQTFPQLGEQVWGLVLPTRPDGSQPVLISLASEQGPVEVYGPDGALLATLAVGGPAREVNELPIRVESVLPASGILLKRDPGVPLVYAGFAIALAGGGLSLLATRQLWAIAEPGRLHLAGLCNRNLTALSRELPQLLAGLTRQQA
jgi:cytochrome c biogenesis protein